MVLLVCATLKLDRKTLEEHRGVISNKSEAGILEQWILVWGIRLRYGGLNPNSLNDCRVCKKIVRKVPGAR